MIRHTHVIRSLPLLADVLGKKYGIRVEIGGAVARTNGTVIQLPSLPVDAGDHLLPLIRGFIDHEAAHIRETDFSANTGLIPLEAKIANTIEDWRVEQKLAALYPGCAENFQWLIKHIFLGKAEEESAEVSHPAIHILDWLLITVRSWDVPELDRDRDFLRSLVDRYFPGLPSELDAILCSIPGACAGTHDVVNYARQLASVIKKYLDDLKDQQDKQQNGQTDDPNAKTQHDPASPKGRESREKDDAALSDAENQLPTSLDSLPEFDGESLAKSIQSLLAAAPQDLPDDLGAILHESVVDACAEANGRIVVAQEDRKPAMPLSAHDRAEVKKATTALRTRLQAFLQSLRSVRNHNGYAGRLDMRKLHGLFTGDAEIFLKKGSCTGINTAVHILLDASFSMKCATHMTLACHACYAIASVLHAIRGISLGVTVFPGNQDGATVSPILQHRQNMHDWFMVAPNGGTPMDSALWWVWRQMYPLPEARKIVLVVTDGMPNRKQDTQVAIKELSCFGMEVYAVGIMESYVTTLFPKGHSRVIQDIRELAPAVFQILQIALMGKKALA